MPATCTTPCAAWSSRPPSVCAADSHVDDFALTPAERALFRALDREAIRYVVIGMGAAMIEGAPVTTQDLDLWLERTEDDRLRRAAAEAGGFWISGFGMQPPAFGGPGL